MTVVMMGFGRCSLQLQETGVRIAKALQHSDEECLFILDGFHLLEEALCPWGGFITDTALARPGTGISKSLLKRIAQADMLIHPGAGDVAAFAAGLGIAGTYDISDPRELEMLRFRYKEGLS